VPAVVFVLATLAGGWNPPHGSFAFAAAASAAPTAEQIKDRLKAVGDKDKFPGADWVVVLDESDVTVQPSGLATTEQCVVTKLLTDEGARAQAVQRFNFDPKTNRIEVLSARVHRADGATEEVDVSNIAVGPAPAGIIFWGEQQKLLSLPRLSVGDAVEIVTSKTGFNVAYLAEAAAAAAGSDGEPLQPPMPGHWYDIVYFDDEKPLIEKTYTVRSPKDKPLQYEVYNGNLVCSLKFDGDHHVYSWSRKDAPAFKGEPMMPAFSDAACKLVLATVPDWQTKSRWFHQANEAQFEADEPLRELVDSIVRENPDPQAHIAAMTHWVAENIRYVGTSRGACEGYTTHSAMETFRDRGGVCKDKAGLLVAMLRAAGYESFITMTMAGSRVEEIPADQFNHAVTTLRLPDGSLRLLDPTWAPKSREMWSSREQLQHVVRGLPEGAPLELTPPSPPEDNLVTCRSEAQFGCAGTLAMTLTLGTEGYPDTAARRWLDRYPPREHRGAFTAACQRLSDSVTIAQLACTDPVDFTKSFAADLTVYAGRYLLGNDGLYLFRLPLLSHPLGEVVAGDLLDPQAIKLEERKFPLHLRSTRLLKYEETLTLPPDWKLSNLPDKRELDGPAAALKFDITASQGRLDYRFELALRKHRVPPDEYKQFKEVIEAAQKLAGHWLIAEPAAAEPTVAEQPSAANGVNRGGTN